MRIAVKLFFIVVVLLSRLSSLYGQPFTTRIYTANDGLPDSYTLGIYQDKAGYLWVGTYTGLSRFDGQRFTTIKSGDEAAQINGNVLLEDHLGRYWINHNLTLCILEKDSILCFPTSDGKPMNYVFGAIELSDHSIWALVDHGAYEFSGTAWKKIEFPSPYAGSNCRQIIETEDGLYFNFEKYIALQKKDGSFVMLTKPEDNSFYINIQKAGNSIYANHVHGILRIENGHATEIFQQQLSQTTNYNFMIDHQQRFWVATEKFGILVSDPGNEEYLEHTITLPFNLSTYFLEDRDHTIWATNYEGLVKISEVAYQRFDRTTGPEYDNVRCIASDAYGNLYIASSGKGVYVLERIAKKTKKLDFDRIAQFEEDVVDAMCFDDYGALWLITRGQKLLRYSKGTTRDLTHLLPATAEYFSGIVFDSLRHQVVLAADKLYVGHERGFVAWGAKFQTEEIPEPTFICLLKDGGILVNTENNGIYRILKDNQLVNVSKQFGLEKEAKEVRFYEDPRGGVWMTYSGGGITKFDIDESDHFRKAFHISTRDGLPNNTITSAGFDSHDKLWLTTLSGMATVSISGSPDSAHVELNRIGEELGRTVLNWGPSGSNLAFDHDGHLWVSTFHELFAFDTDKKDVDKKPPGIAIENIRLNFKETDWRQYADSTSGYFNFPFHPVLDYHENSLGISFKGISFSENPGLMYSYHLSFAKEKQNTDYAETWTDATQSNEVSFVRLPPGEYIFSVKAKEAGTAWSAPASFFFVIRQPFWMTWWFRTAIGLLVLLLIWVIVRIRVKRIQRQAELNQQLNELEMRALKSQMNPHFIYNALNSIQSLVMDGKQAEAVKYMSRFARLLRQVLEHSGANLITLEKELSMIDIYVQLEMLRMNAKLNYEVVLDEQILAEKEYIPPLILQPFIENALWHGLSRREGEKNLRLEINTDDDWLLITVTDNGIGRQKAEELKSGSMDYPRSMGMEITGKRLKTVNHHHVTAIDFHDLKDVQGDPAGTQVRIKIRRYTHINNGKHS